MTKNLETQLVGGGSLGKGEQPFLIEPSNAGRKGDNVAESSPTRTRTKYSTFMFWVVLIIFLMLSRKFVRPTSEMIKSLNLKPGVNKIRYLVHTPLQGDQAVTGNIYLWPKNAKIVISDIDGTITKLH